jgi:hypothetical protein
LLAKFHSHTDNLVTVSPTIPRTTIATMSDQEIKVVEGAEAPKVESTEAKPTTADVETKAEEEKPVDAEMVDAGKGDKAENASVSVRNPPKNMLKVKRPDHSRKEEKNKFDPSVLGDSSDPVEIRTQVNTGLPTEK